MSAGPRTGSGSGVSTQSRNVPFDSARCGAMRAGRGCRTFATMGARLPYPAAIPAAPGLKAIATAAPPCDLVHAPRDRLLVLHRRRPLALPEQPNRLFSAFAQHVVLAIHDRQLAEHGGADGIRDGGAIKSALARPANLAAYGNPDAPELAAAYICGLANNHGFIDGNKRPPALRGASSWPTTVSSWTSLL